MVLTYDKFDRLETPKLILCEISKDRIGVLKTYEVSADLYYTNISEFNFKVPKIINNKQYKYYDDVKELRMIYAQNIGWFQLVDVVEQSDGIQSYKQCKVVSAQWIFQRKRITGLAGEFVLWNPLRLEDSLMPIIISMCPGWTIGYVDSVLYTRQRSLNITDQDLYSLMTNDAYKIFECIFVFDYNKFEINIYDAFKEFQQTEIFLSFENLLKEVSVTPQVDQIVTAIRVIGGNGLDISGVNPTGSDTIYNVDYFKDRMSESLRNALEAYQEKYNDLKTIYSSLLLEYKNKNTEIEILKNNAPKYDISFIANLDGTARITPPLTDVSGLAELEAVRSALEGVRKVRIEQGNIPYTDVNDYIFIVENMLVNKRNSISIAEYQLENIRTQIQSITVQLNMENNFSDAEWIELNDYFFDYTFQENSFIVSDIMTQEEKQAVQLELLATSEKVLEKTCVPKYVFDISSVNFLALPQFAKFIREFDLGVTFTLKINDDYVIRPLLLGVHINFDNLQDFTLKYGNKTSLDEGFDFSALKDSVSMGTSVSFDFAKLEAMKSQSDKVSEFMSGALIAAVNDIKSTETYTEWVLDKNGFRLFTFDYATKQKLPFEAWLTGSQFVFSDDNFMTAKLALGRIRAPGALGGYLYGLVADAVFGTLLAGNELHIANDKNNFRLDETGAWLENANFTITKIQGGITNKIVLDPNEGFSIYRGTERQIYLGTDGNVYFRGTINGGSININNQFMVDEQGNVTIKRGSINIGSGNFIVDAYGNISIKSGSININNRFTVDSLGNVVCEYIDIRGGKFKIGNTTVTEEYFRTNKGYMSNSELDATCQYFGRLVGSQIDVGTLNANRIIAGSITANEIAANAITANKIAANSITSDKIYVNKLSAISADIGEITSGLIMGITIRAGRYYNLNGSAYMEMGNSSLADFTLTGGGNQVFQIYDDVGSVGIRAYGSRFLTSRGYSTTAEGAWNFSSQLNYMGYEVATKQDIDRLEAKINALA